MRRPHACPEARCRHQATTRGLGELKERFSEAQASSISSPTMTDATSWLRVIGAADWLQPA